jgi:hypothetical protein
VSLDKPIAVHVQQEPGRFSTQPGHLDRRKVSSTEQGAAALLVKVSQLGAQARQWAEGLLAERGLEGPRVLVGLLSLAGRHPAARIDRACGTAHAHGCYRLRTVRELLARGEGETSEVSFVQDHPLIRSLVEYGRLVQDPSSQES